jgi:succinoglycan biosynthesis protein ExoM
MIDICICTYRRAHIRDTLQSIAVLTPPGDIRVIVADNDDTPSARALVEDSAHDFGLNVTYIHAPARNISIARNACLTAASAPLVAFIDDDEIVAPGWLAALVTTMENTGADVVLGPVDALYPKAGWMQEGDFHSTRPVLVGDRIMTGYTCNVLFRRNVPALMGLRFRPELGRSGGEDSAFFSEAYRKGARIAYAPDAIVTEVVTPNRATFFWLLKRRFRAGQTHATLTMENPAMSAVTFFALAVVKAAFCFARALFCIVKPTRMKYWLLRGALHVGVMARLLGTPEIEQY